MSKYNNAQKKAFFAGLFKGKKSARVKNKSRSVLPKKKTKATIEDMDLKELSEVFAAHMAHKFSLSASEASENAKQHFLQAKKDPKFKSFLYREYGQYLE